MDKIKMFFKKYRIKIGMLLILSLLLLALIKLADAAEEPEGLSLSSAADSIEAVQNAG